MNCGLQLEEHGGKIRDLQHGSSTYGRRATVWQARDFVKLRHSKPELYMT